MRRRRAGGRLSGVVVVAVVAGALLCVSATARAQIRAHAGSAAATSVPSTRAAAARPTPSPVPSPTPSPTPSATTATVRKVVGLGDSVPAGSACDCTDFVRLVAGGLTSPQGAGATATNLAVGGQTSSGLLALLDGATARRELRDADVVLVTIGANDFDPGQVTDDVCADPASSDCYGGDLAALSTTMTKVLDRIDALSDATVVVTGYWNVFLDGAVGRAQGTAYVHNSDALTKAVNTRLAAAAAQRGATYVDVYTPFKAGGDDTALLAPDGDHPDARGHAVIAAAITTALATSRS